MELEFYVYLALLVLYTLSPVVGAIADDLLRAGVQDEKRYTGIHRLVVLFRCINAMGDVLSMLFMLFPVQFASIYAQHNKMSRNAHYNWTSLFVLLEFINAFVAFLVIPPPCPIKEWTQIVVWMGIFLLLLTINMLTLIRDDDHDHPVGRSRLEVYYANVFQKEERG